MRNSPFVIPVRRPHRGHDMKKRNPCHLQTLAQNEMCAVEYCRGCGAFHVDIGFTTVRLNLQALRAVSGTLVVALEQLDRLTATHRCSTDQSATAKDNLH